MKDKLKKEIEESEEKEECCLFSSVGHCWYCPNKTKE